MAKTLYRNKEWLEYQYNALNKTHDEIALECDVHYGTIYNWINKFGIQLKQEQHKLPKQDVKDSYKNEEWLRYQYVTLQRISEDIANECGVHYSTIYRRLNKLGINLHNEDKVSLSADELYQLYIVDKKSSIEIGLIYDVSSTTIIRWLNQYNIQVRDTSENNKIYFDLHDGRETFRKRMLKQWESRDDEFIKKYSDNMKRLLSDEEWMENRERKMKILWSDDEYRKMRSETTRQRLKDNPETLIKKSATSQGISIEDWNGFINPINDKIRKSSEYKEWRQSVYNRDNYTCQCCGQVSGKINAHHILNFSKNEALRFDVSNGITLCENCHSSNIEGGFHNLYGTYNNTEEQLKEYIQNKQKIININQLGASNEVSFSL
jgi:transposase/5-methylcytosine-specific restriction endonuclease McrA